MMKRVCLFRADCWPFASILAFLSVTTGCENQMGKAAQVMRDLIPHFDHADHAPVLLHSRIVSEADFLGRPRDLAVIGDYLVVSDMVSNPVLHVFRRSSLDFARSFGRRGQGPGEFVSYAVLSNAPDSVDMVYALDPTYRRLTRFSLPDGSVVPFGGLDAIPVPTQQFVYDLKMVNEQRAIGLGFFQAGRLALFDFDAQRTTFAGPTPGTPQEPFVIAQQAHHGYIAPDPARTRVAVVTRLTTDIDFYSITGDHLTRAETPFEFPVDYLVDRDGNFMPGPYNRHGYQGVTVSAGRVYALFSGRAEAHYRGMRGSHAEFVHVFDWSGTLERVFQLDREVLGIAIDPSETLLYAITERPQPAVLVFPVSPPERSRGQR